MTRRSGTSSTWLVWRTRLLRPHGRFLLLVAILTLGVTLTRGQSRPEAFARLTIVTEPGATIVIDDQAPIQVGRNGQAVFEQVRPGAHSVRITQEGKRAVERTITLSPGQTLRVEAPLAPILGRLEILTTAGAMVSIDGEPRGKADALGVLRVSNVRMGRRRITAERAGYQPRETALTVRADLELTVLLELTAIVVPSVPRRGLSLPTFTVARTIPWPKFAYREGVYISPDGSWFALCNGVGIAFWDVATGRLRAELEDYPEASGCRIAASRERLAVETVGGVAFVDPGTGKQMQSVTFPTIDGERFSQMSAVAFDHAGSRLAMANWGVRVTVIETASRRQVWTSNLRPENSSLGESLSLAFSPDGRSLAAVGSHVFLVLDAATGAVKTEFAQREVHAAPVAFSPDGRWLVGPADGPAFQLWDVETKRPSYRWPVVDEGSLVNKCASFSPDGRYLLLGRGPEQLGIIDLSTGQDVAEIKSAIDISACAITPDWRVLVTAGGGYVQVWQRK